MREDREDIVIPRSMSTLADSLSSHHYKSYMVSMFHKLNTKEKIQLGKVSFGNVGSLPDNVVKLLEGIKILVNSPTFTLLCKDRGG